MSFVQLSQVLLLGDKYVCLSAKLRSDSAAAHDEFRSLLCMPVSSRLQVQLLKCPARRCVELKIKKVDYFSTPFLRNLLFASFYRHKISTAIA